jgi:uncharacterized Zn finger protein (UPF0148 family)
MGKCDMSPSRAGETGMRTCPTCPKPLIGKRRHCPICQAKRENARKVAKRLTDERDTRIRIATIAGKARAAKFMSDKERAIEQKHGPEGLALYRMGKRDGANRNELRWREWYAREFGGTVRRTA